MGIPPWLTPKLNSADLVKLDSGNALTGPMKLCAIAPFAWAAGAYVMSASVALATLLFVIGGLPILACIAIELRFAWKSPDLMKSDQMQLRKHALDMIQQHDYSSEDLRALERIVTAPVRDLPLLSAPDDADHHKT